MANYTQHYQLHQWVPEDDFLRTDFNTDFQKIDAALAGLEADKVGQSAVTALQSSISAAQSTANGRARAIRGTFTGNSTFPRTINVGASPKIVFMGEGAESLSTLTTATNNRHFRLTSSGFAMDEDSYSWVNRTGTTYVYVAIV